MSKSKSVKVRKSDIGKVCKVFWNDIGTQDGIYVGKNGCGYHQVFQFSDRQLATISNDQIVWFGKHILAKDVIK